MANNNAYVTVLIEQVEDIRKTYSQVSYHEKYCSLATTLVHPNLVRIYSDFPGL